MKTVAGPVSLNLKFCFNLPCRILKKSRQVVPEVFDDADEDAVLLSVHRGEVVWVGRRCRVFIF